MPELYKMPYRRIPSWCGKSFLHIPEKARRLFIDIEDLCRRKGFLVLEYIRDAPLYAAEEMKVFSPYKYLDPAFIECYEASVKANNPQYVWPSQIQSLVDRAGRMVPGRYATINDLLLDIHQPFTAWFRVLYPRELDKRLVDVYGNDAKQEIFSDLVLKDFLTKLSPMVDLTRIGISV